MLITGLINALVYLVNVIVMLVLVQFVLGLLLAFNVVNRNNDFVNAIWRALNALLDPVLKPIRKILPNTGGIDFSPMVLVIGLNVLILLLEPLKYG